MSETSRGCELSERSNQVDSVVSAAVIRFLDPALATPFSLCAVGGYGRSELFPYSDIDLLLLFEEEADLARIKAPLEPFLRSLWDAGLRVSHSVRTVAECCRIQDQNTELHISILDLRFLCGTRELFGRFREKLAHFYARYGGAIMRRLAELARQRHLKFNNTVYHLEPNVKETPGGIRDIHLLHWLSLLAPQHAIIRESLTGLDQDRRFFCSVRSFLHLQAGRDNNLLTFELQDDAARSLPDEPLDPAEWMRDYFRHARRIFQSSLRALEYVDSQDASLIRQFRDWRSRLSSREFTVVRERIFLRNPAETLQSPESVLNLLTFGAKHRIQLSWDTQRRISEALKSLERAFEVHPPRWSAWAGLLSQPHTALALREMQQTGFLTAAIPEWHAIDSLVVRDFYHRYTVDEHTFVAIENIDRLQISGPEGSDFEVAPSALHPRFQEILMEEENPAVLRFALLLHDIGKGTHPGDHVHGSIETSKIIMGRFNVPVPIQETVLFLIEHHLDLSSIMNGRDLDDPATARFLTSCVPTTELLRSLVLLTYADISAVNPTAMTPWRVEQLWRVYSAGLAQFNRELSADRVRASVSPFGDDAVCAELARFLDGLPTRYLRTHSRDEIDGHAQLYNRFEREGAAVELEDRAGTYLLTMLAPDRPGLFASLCGTLASFGMNIVKAEAASNSQHCIVDLIRFTDPNRTLELNPDEVETLKRTITSVIDGSVNVADLLKRRRPAPRPTPNAQIHPLVHFNNEASDSSTLIEFVGEDRPGLLYDLASTLSRFGCNVELVVIDTQAHRALDVFYVTRESRKLSEADEPGLRDELLRAANPGLS